MTRDSAPGSLAVDLAWSLWRELGVPAAVRNHAGCLVVPEPLIVFTAALGERDRRLRAQAVAWCASHLSLLSVRALRNSYTQERWGVGAVADFSATMKELVGGTWPGETVGEAFPVDASFEGWTAPYEEPSQLALRLRSLLGVSVRAEVLRVLLTSEAVAHTYGELAQRALATKRQTTEAVEQLGRSGAVHIDRTRQPHRVRISRRTDWESLVGPFPELAPDWSPLLRLSYVAVETLEATAEMPVDLGGAELHRALRLHEELIARVGLQPPPASPPETYASRVQRWFYDLLEQTALCPASRI